MTPINRTPFAVDCRSVQSVAGGWLQVVVVKGTFRIVPNQRCEPHPTQRPIQVDQIHLDLFGRSLAWANDLAPFKPNTDFTIMGSFHQPDGVPAPTGRGSFTFGPLRKELRFFGPRMAVRNGKEWAVSPAAPMTSVPLRWELSAGGLSDRRNPFGKGIDAVLRSAPPQYPLPQIEDPRDPIRTPDDRPTPDNFAPMPPGFAARQVLLGTRDQRWAVFRAPFPPEDADPAFHNAAPAGQQAGNYPNGTETIQLTNLHPTLPSLSFALPGLLPRVGLLRGPIDPEQPDRLLVPEEVTMQLDTVVALPDEDQLVLTWRGHTVLAGEPPVQDVVWVECDIVPVGLPPAPFAEFAEAMLARFRAANTPPEKPDPDAAARRLAADKAAGEAGAAQAIAEVRAMLPKLKIPDELRKLLETENDPEIMLAAVEKHFNEVATELGRKHGLPPPP